MIPQKLDFRAVESLLSQRLERNGMTSLKDLPHPARLKNVFEIAQALKKAMEEKKRIVVVGDYDVDGVVSCAILQDFFKKLQYPISIEIPNRFSDGYGLSVGIVERLCCDVILTVDNGINAIEAANLCKQKGIELLITDHHTPQENLPNALVCNPKLSDDFPEPEICGACVAWYLCAALKAEMGLEIQMVESLDLLALAIVSDVMPLRGLNYLLLKKGLEVFKTSQRVPFIHLKNHFSKYNFDAQLIGYYIAPLLNCAGRMDSAVLAYRFLVEEDCAESKRLLEELLVLNAQRKQLQNQIYQEAKEMFCAQKNYQELPFILVSHLQWHEGIVGIIAARLSEEFRKPCIVLTQKDGILKGSMRSVNVDCMEILESTKKYLCAFGGHFGAAGLSLKPESLEDFREALMEIKYSPVEKELNLPQVLGWLPLGVVDSSLFKIVQNYAPFGYENVIPKFYTQAKITNVNYFGRGHSQVFLSDESGQCKALVFDEDLRKEKGRMLECVYSLQWDRYASDVVLYLDSYTFLEN